MNATIEVKQIPEMNLAAVSFTGPEQTAHAYRTIMQWAAPRGFLNENTKMVTIYHDSFKITEPDRVRMSACILLDQPVEGNGEVVSKTITPNNCIVGRFEIGMNEFEKAWTGLFAWMNENGYAKADLDPFEIYHNNPNEHPRGIAIVDFCIPIRSS